MRGVPAAPLHVSEKTHKQRRRQAGGHESGTKVPHSEKAAARADVTVVWLFTAFYAAASAIKRYRNRSESITVHSRLF
jgi:hypothetical protein